MIKEKVCEFINKVKLKQIYNINIDSKLYEDLNLDSLNIISLVIFIEYEFNIIITDKEISDFITVKDIINLIDFKLNQ